jgi:twitching motility protein PilT
MTPAIAHLLSTDKIYQIPMKLETGRAQGMQLLDQALLEAVQRKQIDPDDAYRHAQDKKPFQRFVTDPHLLPKISLVGA